METDGKSSEGRRKQFWRKLGERSKHKNMYKREKIMS